MSCGRPIKEEGLEPIGPPSGSSTEMKSMLLLGLSFMALFFGIFMLIPAYFLQSTILFLVCCIVIVTGVLMLLARFFVLKRYSRKVEQFRTEAAEKVKCKYCGSMNSLEAEKCIGCHAPL